MPLVLDPKEYMSKKLIMRQDEKHPDSIVLLGLTLLFLLLGMFVGQLLAAWCSAQVSGNVFAGAVEVSALSTADRNWIRLSLLLTNTFAFAVPGLLVAWLVLGDQRTSFFGLHRSVPYRGWALAAAFFVASLPVVAYSLWWNQQLDLPELLQGMEEGANRLLEAIFTFDSWLEFPLTFLAVAIAPAIGEELIFRGILQKQLERGTGSGWLAVLLTAAIFSAIHLQFAGFVPRFLLGVILGAIYLWTRNLWVPIVIHLLHNGVQVTAAFATEDYQFEPEMSEAPSAWLALAGLVAAVAAGWLLHRARPEEEAAFAE